MNPTEPQGAYSVQGGAGGRRRSGAGAVMSPADAGAEIELARRMAEGDERALGELYDRYSPTMYALAMHLLHDADEAEEIVEETFWQAWRQASRYEPSRGSVATWLTMIARSRGLDRVRMRRRSREEPLPVEDLLAAPESEDSAERGERASMVRAALRELPEEQREVIRLAYFGGLSQTEIAESTGQPLGTVKTRVRLAMQKLRDRLAPLREEPV